MITLASFPPGPAPEVAADVLRRLGYPIDPLPVRCDEWRRAGIDIGWNGDAVLQLLSRLRRFDLFLLEGRVTADQIARFLRSYRDYNVLVRSVVVSAGRDSRRVALYDLSDTGTVRRLDIDLDNPTQLSIDRLNLLEITNGAPTSIHRLFDRALDREALSRRFFDRFRRSVDQAAAEILAQCPGGGREACRTQALLILSRLLFLSFIQEKGWLNGERRFLIDRLVAAVGKGRNFFASVVKPLFFGCLNTPLHQRNGAARRLGAIPYLNGGLFEPSAFERSWPRVQLSNGLMQEIIEETFEKFDFSVDERDTAGVRVDPEMLGKVFETLMASEERASSGSFYTPREIVGALARRAIGDWLTGSDPNVLDAIEAGTVEPRVATQLLERLRTVTVLDPACGSGAFLLSALMVIEQWMQKLAAVSGSLLEPDLRQRIVERSLYGVDLKLEAVRLCELRLWLAIVSATETEVEKVRPLPNLDRNILQGNALLSPTDFLGDGRGDVYAEWRSAIRAQKDLIERYRNGLRADRPALARLIRANDVRIAADLLARSMERDEEELRILATPKRDLFGQTGEPSTPRCRELQQRIEMTRRRLHGVEEGMLDFFSFDIHFAPVVSSGGFDVILGNPPWVRNGRIDPRAKKMLAERYTVLRASGSRTAFHQPDLSLAFFERSLSLVREDGVVGMLLPAKVLNAAYAGRFRAEMRKHDLLEICDWSGRGRRHFDADTFPLSLVLRRAGCRDRDVSVQVASERFLLPQNEVPADGPESEWVLAPPHVREVMRRLREVHAPLARVLDRQPLMGVKTGQNDVFFLDDAELHDGHLVTHDGIAVPLSAVSRCIRGRDLRRWRADASHWMLWPPREGWGEKPPRWLVKLAEARGTDPAAVRLSYVRPEHAGIKVAWKDVSRGMAAAVLPDTVAAGGHSFLLVPNQTLYSIDAVSLDEAYVIAAVLNSAIFDALVLAVAERAKDAHFRYFARTVASIPFPSIAAGSRSWALLSRLARRAHCGEENRTALDLAVAGAYGLDAGDLSVLKRYADRQLERTPC